VKIYEQGQPCSQLEYAFAFVTMFTKFEQQLSVLTERSKTMGIEEFLLDQAEKKGRRETSTEKDTAFVKNLLSSTDFNTLKIAQLVGVGEDFVLEIKKEMNRQGE
jgi:hypothetical protein